MTDYEREREIEDSVDEEQQRVIAIRKLTTGLLDVDGDDRGDGEHLGVVEAAQRTVDRVEEMEHELAEIRRVLEDHAEQLSRFEDIGAGKTSKEEKIAQVVQFADNQRTADQQRVTVLPKSIKGVVGVSRRYAYDLVDDMVAEYAWALDPQEQPRRADQDKPQRGVLVDFEQLHTDHGSVNKFTTRIADEGASA